MREEAGPEVLLSGPAGTGKSRACLDRLHALALQYPGMRGLILRKTRESLTESALVTFEEKVLGGSHPLASGAGRAHRKAYTYANGSVLVVAGLRSSGKDQTQKVMSTEYDVAYVQEAIELTEAEWEQATTRLRNGVMPFQQVIADTNPDSPTHWLKRRCDAGKTLLLESRHQDNPLLWDLNAGDWTEFGRSYITRLDALSGNRKQRLRYGRWVQAEGVVYDGWDAAIHLIDRFFVPASWPRFWSVDFGFTNPFSAQLWATDPDGRLYLVREIYHTQRLVEDHAKDMMRIGRYHPRPKAVVCDHDAEGRATLEACFSRPDAPEHYRGLKTTPASKAIREGIQAVQARLRVQKDGRPRLYVMRDSLDRVDPNLVEAKKPRSTVEEFDAYCWNTGGIREKEDPVDANNHGMDSLRYQVFHMDRPRRKGGALR